MRSFCLVTKGDSSCPQKSGIMMNKGIQLYKEHNTTCLTKFQGRQEICFFLSECVH
jgi:hypothetical protein